MSYVILWSNSEMLTLTLEHQDDWDFGGIRVADNPPGWNHWWVSWFNCCNLV